MTAEPQHLPTGSAFSREIFKEIASTIPRSVWPIEALPAVFTPDSKGRFLVAAFDELPKTYAHAAALKVRLAGVRLVMESPVAWWAVEVYRVTRWRDTCFFAMLPLLFAIPFMAAFSADAMRISALVFAVDTAALIITHLLLMKKRIQLVNRRFSADIPVPGLRLRMGFGPSASAEAHAALGEGIELE